MGWANTNSIYQRDWYCLRTYSWLILLCTGDDPQAPSAPEFPVGPIP
jgi:hypothetical protein